MLSGLNSQDSSGKRSPFLCQRHSKIAAILSKQTQRFPTWILPTWEEAMLWAEPGLSLWRNMDWSRRLFIAFKKLFLWVVFQKTAYCKGSSFHIWLLCKTCGWPHCLSMTRPDTDPQNFQFFVTYNIGWGFPSLVVPWLRIYLPMQRTQAQSLVPEDLTCCRATKPMHHNYWNCALEPLFYNKRNHHNEKPMDHK